MNIDDFNALDAESARADVAVRPAVDDGIHP